MSTDETKVVEESLDGIGNLFQDSEYGYQFTSLDAPAESAAPAAPETVMEPVLSPAAVAPPLPEGWISSPSLDLAFLGEPIMIPDEAAVEEAADPASAPPPAAAASPSTPSTPDVRPGAVSGAPPGSETAAVEAGGTAEETAEETAGAAGEETGIETSPPPPSAVEAPPAPVANPPAPVAGEPNLDVGEAPSGAVVPSGGVAGAPEPQASEPSPASIQVTMPGDLAESMAKVLEDVLAGSSS